MNKNYSIWVKSDGRIAMDAFLRPAESLRLELRCQLVHGDYDLDQKYLRACSAEATRASRYPGEICPGVQMDFVDYAMQRSFFDLLASGA